MQDNNEQSEENWDDYEKSKSRVKGEMTELQKLGLAIAELPEDKQQRFEMGDALRFALEELKRIKHKNARRRHAQYIGKLIRKEDTEAIQATWDAIQDEHNVQVRQLHQVEQWRDRLILDGQDALDAFLSEYPSADRQQLRHLLQSINADKRKNKPPTSARKLFKFIQALLQSSDEH